MINVADFAVACKHLTSDEIYNLFEYDISDALRNEIISRAAVDSNEPVREALNNIGRTFSVQSLADY
jgi:hypothetical protein